MTYKPRAQQALRDRSRQVRFSYDHMFAAMCIMEEIADPQLPDAGQPWNEMRQSCGINDLREVVIERLAIPCNDAWMKVWDAYNRIDEPGCAPNTTQDPGSFDYEFVPTWLRLNVDWSDNEAGPRVRGSGK